MLFLQTSVSFRAPGGVARGLDSDTRPKSVCGSWALWSPVASRGIPWSSVVFRGLPPRTYQN